MSEATEHDCELCRYADRVATRVAGEKPAEESGFGVDWTALAELIEQIILVISENCPAQDAKVVRMVKNPRRRQRSRFRAQVYGCCNQCSTYRWRQESGNIADQMMLEIASMEDAEVLAVVFEARHDDWILV